MRDRQRATEDRVGIAVGRLIDEVLQETRAREVTLYFRQLKPKEVKTVPIDLVATVPGRYTGPASRAYLYYTNDEKIWNDPIEVVVTR